MYRPDLLTPLTPHPGRRYNPAMARQTKHATHSRRAIAAHAARLMAEDGVSEFGTAKRKAARQLGFSEADALPSNDEVEIELRAYHALFQHDEQQVRLDCMRTVAIDLMDLLGQYQPCLTGPALHGTAVRGSAIDIDLFADSMKNPEVWLIDTGIKYRTIERRHFNRAIERKVPVLTFDYRGYTVNLAVYEVNDRRGALVPDSDGAPARGDIAAVRRLLDPPSGEASIGLIGGTSAWNRR